MNAVPASLVSQYPAMDAAPTNEVTTNEAKRTDRGLFIELKVSGTVCVEKPLAVTYSGDFPMKKRSLSATIGFTESKTYHLRLRSIDTLIKKTGGVHAPPVLYLFGSSFQ